MGHLPRGIVTLGGRLVVFTIFLIIVLGKGRLRDIEKDVSRAAIYESIFHMLLYVCGCACII